MAGLASPLSFQPAEINVVIERILAVRECQGVGAALADMAILAVIAGVGDEQAAVGQRHGGGAVVKQIVAVRNEDRAGPVVAVEIDGVRHPDRADLRAEIVLASAGQKPDAAAGIADDAGDVVVDIAADGSRLRRRRPAVAAGRASGSGFGSAPPARIGAGQRLGDELSRFHPLAVLQNDEADLAIAIEADAVAIVKRRLAAPVFAPGRAAFFVSDPQRAFAVVSDGRAGFIIVGVGGGAGFAGFARFVELANPDVVVAFVIGVPGDGDACRRVLVAAIAGAQQLRDCVLTVCSADQPLPS